MRWTKAFRKSAGKELTVDAAFEFEKRRDQPVRYDRDLVATTLRAMKKVEEIKSAREKRHWARRMEVQKRSQRAQVGRRRAWNRRASGRVVIVCAAHAQDKVDIERNIDLVAPAVVRAREEVVKVSKVRKTEDVDMAGGDDA